MFSIYIHIAPPYIFMHVEVTDGAKWLYNEGLYAPPLKDNMSSEITNFVFDNSFTVRTKLDENGDPWFVAKDVCAVLSISNHNDALNRLDDDEKDGVGIADPHGRDQLTTMINESGLYNLIMTSRKAEAKKFKKWVTSEVLPSIRKTGSFTVKTQNVPLLPDQVFSQAAALNNLNSANFPAINPNIIQLMRDAAQNNLMLALGASSSVTPPKQPLIIGVIEIAKKYLNVNLQKHGVSLGKYVAMRIRLAGGNITKVERICSGEMRTINGYDEPDHAQIVEYIEDWIMRNPTLN